MYLGRFITTAVLLLLVVLGVVAVVTGETGGFQMILHPSWMASDSDSPRLATATATIHSFHSERLSGWSRPPATWPLAGAKTAATAPCAATTRGAWLSGVIHRGG